MTIQATIAVNRFGLGAKPGEIRAVSSDPRGWLKRQVDGDRSLPGPIEALPRSAQVFGVAAEGREQRREQRRQLPSESEIAQRIAATVREKLAPMYLDQVAARYQVAVRTEEPLRERLVHFWSNHFATSADKIVVLGLAGTLENEAVRPHLGGSFLDLLMAVESHPAMILYLDNQASMGPNSSLARQAARRARDNARKLDINENLAREILELHTLGVGGGYTQADVTAFAQALTGWSVGGSGGLLAQGEPGKFVFREGLHEPGAKQLLGKRYAQDGVAQPRAVLADLARHPATATHLATKLVRHFVADDPPAAAVEHVAKVFRESDGNLPAVHRALIDLPQAWAQPAVKFKTPHDFVVSTFRALDFVPDRAQQFLAPFQLLGQRPYTPGSPAGWPDIAARWDGPDALLKRIEWATAMGERMGSRQQPLELGEHVLDAGFSERTRTAVARAASAEQGIALLLASPEFQRR